MNCRGDEQEWVFKAIQDYARLRVQQFEAREDYKKKFPKVYNEVSEHRKYWDDRPIGYQRRKIRFIAERFGVTFREVYSALIDVNLPLLLGKDPKVDEFIALRLRGDLYI